MRYKVHFEITTEGFLEIEAINEEDAKESAMSLLEDVRLELPPGVHEVSIEAYEPDVMFREIYEAD